MELHGLVIEEIVRRALAEDIGRGDVTTACVVPPGVAGKGVILARQELVVAGLQVATLVFRLVDPAMRFTQMVGEGDRARRGAALAHVEGTARSILTAERVALNFLQRLSGIATATADVVERVKPYGTRIVDTRKTTPGMRGLEKYAVRTGGGHNHRFGLDDGILIKDNHLAAAGGISSAIAAARAAAPHTLRIEVEVETLAQLEEAIAGGADAVLLDNMDLDILRQATEMARGKVITEASGGITPENVARVASTGVDIISLGYLTHSAPAVDIALELICGK